MITIPLIVLLFLSYNNAYIFATSFALAHGTHGFYRGVKAKKLNPVKCLFLFIFLYFLSAYIGIPIFICISLLIFNLHVVADEIHLRGQNYSLAYWPGLITLVIIIIVFSFKVSFPSVK